MPRHRTRKGRSPVSTEAPRSILSDFWATAIRSLGRRLFFVDTGAIIGCMDSRDRVVNEFLDELVGDRLVTSSHVLAETVRRIVKAKPEAQHRWVGPRGERGLDLAIHILKDWLAERNVAVIHIPEIVFDAAKRTFEARRHVNCDLTDVLSYEVVRGLQQDRIISPDGHFRALGLTCYPL